MLFSKHVIISSSEKNPFTNSSDYKEKSHQDRYLFNGKFYKKITYKKQHNNFFWKLGQFWLALFGTLSIVPLFTNRQEIKALWKRCVTGEELKVVLIANQQLTPKGILKKPGENREKSSKKVHFGKYKRRSLKLKRNLKK